MPEPTRASNNYVKWGGGVARLLPTLADRLNRIIKADKALANILHEFEKNSLLKIAIFPDLDLIATLCKFNLSQEGVKDSYSVGLGFTCLPATFTAPGD
jgi:hypothetical protein